MKKFLTVVFFILINLTIQSIEKKDKAHLKRTVAILPFYNQNSVEKYDYLSDTVRDSLKAKLIITDSFIITSFSLIEDKMKKYSLSAGEAIRDDNTKKIAYAVKSDIAVVGKYIIIEDKIMVNIEAIDIFTGQITATSQINGEIGLDIFRIVNKVTEEITAKMNSKLKMVDSTYFTEMSKKLKEEQLRSFFTGMRITGIVLTSSGTCLFLTGVPLFIYDIANYSAIVRYGKEYGEKTDSGYKTYYDSYWTFVGLLSGSIVLISTGLILTAIGIPLIVYKSENKKITLDIGLRGESLMFTMRWKL